MPLPGGPADKIGNRYERWWTVYQLIRMLHGQAESIRIEDPGASKAEFVIISKGRRELHQAKRSHQDGKWSLASLAASDVRLLQAMFDQLLGSDARFVFVSGSEAGELKELVLRAESAETADEFESRFLGAKGQTNNFEKLRKYWKNTDAATAYEMLHRIDVRTIDERSIEENVKWGLRALFLADPDKICAELRCFAEDSIHRTITREALIARLNQRGFALRRLAKLGEATILIGEVTERYLATGRRKLIRKSLIPRAATQMLLERLRGDPRGSDSVLIGKAGAGKTGCVIEFVEALRARSVPAVVLAFRLDRLKPVSTTAELGEQLGLKESPALVLAAASAGREAVLVVDQLDFVSTTSGRSSDFFEAIEGLLAEARGLRDRLKLHIVVVCREFDWENDHRLRRMLSGENAKIEVTEFSPDEVKAVLSTQGFHTEKFQQRQLELLRLPQNLSLFLDAAFDPAKAPKFNTAKELFDRYWDEKRRAVAERTAPLSEQWADVVQLLCEEMTRTQQLFVPREKLDQIAPGYLNQMASEGVLTFDGRRYGFGHESFFDYCFARAFVAKNQPLADFLAASEQHLFRRAQVRQVLSYLRDADRQRYCKELLALLKDNRIRLHLKDLALGLAVDVPDPSDDEWAILEPWINSELAALAKGERNPDKLASLVWQHYFGSQSLFTIADRRGLVAGWLASENTNIANIAVIYLQRHQLYAADRVAELLEPYVNAGGEWPNRLRIIMEWGEFEKSRRYFDLFLRLLDNGTLDIARSPIAVNATYWHMLHGLGNARPEWISEVLAHWLRRRMLVLQKQRDEHGKTPWRDLFERGSSGCELIHDAAEKAPAEFVKNILPIVLEISDIAISEDQDELPKRDEVWYSLFYGGPESMDETCLNALLYALQILAKDEAVDLNNIISELRRRNTYISNFLLLGLYAASPNRFPDDAVLLLSAEPWRFGCGYSGSPYWMAVQLIRAIMPHCSSDNRAKLEKTILSYTPAYERSKSGHKAFGWTRYTLLEAIPPEYRSINAQARFDELERKFGKQDSTPRETCSFVVGPPIEKDAADKMTDEHWLKAIAKYADDEWGYHRGDPEKGGAQELSTMLGEYARKEPERFARLCLKYPASTNPVYIARTLDGLKGTAAPIELKLAVCRKAYSESRVKCGRAIADLLGSIKEPLPEDAIQILDWLATEHPDPDTELWAVEAATGQPYYGGDILSYGINTTRGHAAEAIRDLILDDTGYIARFRATLYRLVGDKSISVRSCIAGTLLAVARHDMPLALDLFNKLDTTDDRILSTQYVNRFIYYGIRQQFEQLRPYVERMLRSREPKVSEAGARLAGLAALHHDDAADLAQEAMSGSPSQRLGVAQVASANIADPECRMWCENHLLVLFNDDDREVRRESASCFRQLKNEPLETYEKLILAFCDSAAYREDSSSILHALEESLLRIPGITCIVCEKFLKRFGAEAKDNRMHRALDVHIVAKLIFRTYHQHQGDKWASRCLDLIDRFCLEGIHDARTELDEYER